MNHRVQRFVRSIRSSFARPGAAFAHYNELRGKETVSIIVDLQGKVVARASGPGNPMTVTTDAKINKVLEGTAYLGQLMNDIDFGLMYALKQAETNPYSNVNLNLHDAHVTRIYWPDESRPDKAKVEASIHRHK